MKQPYLDGDPAALTPVYDGYLADPYVWETNGVYYAIGTGGPEAVGNAEGGAATGRAVPLLRSTDLKHWELVHRALIHPDPALGSEVWAPAVCEQGVTFYMYYSIGECRAGKSHQLRVATADTPEGPYTDSGAPLLLPGEEEFVFDPHPFRDDDGQWYLFYNRNFLDIDPITRGQAGDAISMRRLETMTRLSEESICIVRPFADWQRSPARNYNGKHIDWHTTEGGCVVKRFGKYYCFYSGSAWHTEKYGVDYVVADTVVGPYRDNNMTAAPRILRAIPDILRGPGHNSLVVGPDGRDYIVFHAWDAPMQKRQMYVAPLVWR